MPMRRHFAVLALFVVSSTACAAPQDDTWMSITLGGRKIGSMHTTRSVQGDRVRTVQTMNLELERTGTKVGLGTVETNDETRDGKPLAFETRAKISGSESVVRGTVKGDQAEVTSTVGGATQTRTVPWPKGALLAEGLRLAEERAGLNPGTHYNLLAFQPETLDAVELETTIGARSAVDLPGGRRDLVRVEQIIHLPGAPTRSVTWVDNDFDALKMVLPVMGYDLEMLACTRTCAQAPNQSTDILSGGLVAAPRKLSADELAHGVTLRIRARDGGEALQFARTDEQQVRGSGDTIDLRIAPVGAGSADVEGKPDPADFHPNDWLQSDAPEIVKLAAQGAGDAKTPREQM
ncbi:MAG TPA: hypothetical protein VF132_04720, partial [Rudaea sp.]